eukprot:403343971
MECGIAIKYEGQLIPLNILKFDDHADSQKQKEFNKAIDGSLIQEESMLNIISELGIQQDKHKFIKKNILAEIPDVARKELTLLIQKTLKLKSHQKKTSKRDQKRILSLMNPRRLKRSAQDCMMKTEEQLKYLQSEFSKNPFWDKQKMTQISQLTGLSETKIYKWNWDRLEQQRYDIQRNNLKNSNSPKIIFKVENLREKVCTREMKKE